PGAGSRRARGGSARAAAHLQGPRQGRRAGGPVGPVLGGRGQRRLGRPASRLGGPGGPGAVAAVDCSTPGRSRPGPGPVRRGDGRGPAAPQLSPAPAVLTYDMVTEATARTRPLCC